MDIKEYQEKSKRTVNKELSKNEVLGNMGLGLTGEAGEVADIIKKHLYQGHDLVVDDIKDELGDVMWYIANLCSACDLELEDVLEYNVKKLQKRFPDGFTEEDSINREEANNE